MYTAAKTVWNKKNAQALGLMQATILPVIWQSGSLWDALETCFGKAGGAATYLQLVNMVKIQFTGSMDLLAHIQEFLDNYSRIMSNSHCNFPKTWQLPCFVPVYLNHMNQWLSNTLITSW